MGDLMRVWIGHGVEGTFVDREAARVSAFDHGFTVGDGVFETMRLAKGRVFLWPWHLERLHAAADTMGIALPSDAHLTAVVRNVAREFVDDERARLRITVTSGAGPAGTVRGTDACTLVVAGASVSPWPATTKLMFVDWPRNEHSPLIRVKSTSYAECVLALSAAQRAGFDEGVFLNTEGRITEGTGSNVFIVRDDFVLTPLLSDGLLPGITRRFVLSLGDAAIPIREQSITRAELESADEVFITSSTRDIQPVERVGAQVYGIGPITRALQARFADRAQSEQHWL